MELKDELDPRYNRATWYAQRVAWALMALFLLLALIGLFGTGPISNTTQQASAGGQDVSVEYARFARLQSPLDLNVTVEAPGADGEPRIVLSRGFVDAVQIDSVTPEPDSTSLTSEGLAYTWTVEDWSAPARVAFSYYSHDFPSLDGGISVQAGDGEPHEMSFSQLIFP